MENVSVSFSNFYDYMFAEEEDDDDDDEGGGGLAGLLSLLTLAGVTAGLVISGKGDIALKAGFAAGVIAGFVPTLYSSLNHALAAGVSAWVVGILSMIFIPFTLAFFFVLVEFVIGGTTD
jgi:hypothetical protein